MFEIGVFRNGASRLPVVITADGVAVNDGSLAEVHAAAQEFLISQVRQGVFAEKKRFPVVLAHRAAFPAGRRGNEPEPAIYPNGDRRADKEPQALTDP